MGEHASVLELTLQKAVCCFKKAVCLRQDQTRLFTLNHNSIESFIHCKSISGCLDAASM